MNGPKAAPKKALAVKARALKTNTGFVNSCQEVGIISLKVSLIFSSFDGRLPSLMNCSLL